MSARLVLSLATSVTTITGMWLVGRKLASGWAVGLANQALWLALIMVTRAWGLLLLLVALVGIYSRNLWLWTRSCPLACTEGHTYGRWCKAR